MHRACVEPHRWVEIHSHGHSSEVLEVDEFRILEAAVRVGPVPEVAELRPVLTVSGCRVFQRALHVCWGVLLEKESEWIGVHDRETGKMEIRPQRPSLYLRRSSRTTFFASAHRGVTATQIMGPFLPLVTRTAEAPRSVHPASFVFGSRSSKTNDNGGLILCQSVSGDWIPGWRNSKSLERCHCSPQPNEARSRRINVRS